MKNQIAQQKLTIAARSVRRLLGYMILVFMCPLAGAWLSNKSLGAYLSFPPIPGEVQSYEFSWLVFCLIASVSMIILKPFLSGMISSNAPPVTGYRVKHRFPFWGWLGCVMMISAWLLAWNRFEWFEVLQEFTFTPLWLGYILIINALTYRRTGRCLLINHTDYILILFLVSAVFWWSFEYLNRIVQNWYYVGISEFGPGRYFIYATLPFSTVLPSVLGTAEWINSFTTFGVELKYFKALPFATTKIAAVCCIIVSVIGLAVLGIWPKALYSLVWIAPILLVIGLHSLTEKPPLLVEIESGDWRRTWILALSGLVCGFFWEMWNVHSLAHWKYSVPHVQRFEIFEMPLLGYLGYLPFGILCGLFAEYILPGSRKGDRD